MSETTSSETLVLKRTYHAEPERVFRAWIVRADLERWYTPGEGWEVRVEEHDARPGGRSTVVFGPHGELPYVEVTTYLEISSPSLLRFTTHLTHGDEVVADTECRVEFRSVTTGTEVVMNETGYPPERMAERHQGWSETLDHLHPVVEAG